MQCPSPLSLEDPNANHRSIRITVPCGKCGACLHNRRSDWSFRLKQEAKASKSLYFITLTYDDENIPYTDPDVNGVVLQNLKKKDVQNFLKRLRKHQSNITDIKIRYYLVGEYGTKTSRPHYHLLAFNLCQQTLNEIHYLWGKSTNTPHVGLISDASIHYVAKYHLNPNKKPDGRQAEFALMSRRPGIGNTYIQLTTDWHRENKYTHIINNGYKQRMPKFYKDKIFSKEELQLLAEQNQEIYHTSYNNEVERLNKLNINSPESYMAQSDYRKAKNVKKKVDDNDLF